jgi:hypothetical protein
MEHIRGLIEEISILQKKAELLDNILFYYDKETMTFNIPEKYKNKNIFVDDKLKQIPKSPRHIINKDMNDLLPRYEQHKYVNYDELHKTLADK